MDADTLSDKNLKAIQSYCQNGSSKFFYKGVIGASSIYEAIRTAKRWKDESMEKPFSAKSVMEAGTMFALYRDLCMRHASRSMLWKKGLDQKLFDTIMVQAKNLNLDEK